MKQLLLAVMALTILLSGMPATAQDDLTGHAWRTLPEAVKLAYVNAYMEGYRWGHVTGSLLAFGKTVKWAKTKICGESDEVLSAVRFAPAQQPSISTISHEGSLWRRCPDS